MYWYHSVIVTEICTRFVHLFEDLAKKPTFHSSLCSLFTPPTLCLCTSTPCLFQGTRCLAGTRKEGESGKFSDTVGFMTNNMMLIVQVICCNMKPTERCTRMNAALFYQQRVRGMVLKEHRLKEALNAVGAKVGSTCVRGSRTDSFTSCS